MKGGTDDLVEKRCLSRHRKLCWKLVGKTRSGCKIPVATQAFVKVELSGNTWVFTLAELSTLISSVSQSPTEKNNSEELLYMLNGQTTGGYMPARLWHAQLAKKKTPTISQLPKLRGSAQSLGLDNMW